MRDLVSELNTVLSTAMTGSVVRTDGLTVTVAGLPAPIGSVVQIQRPRGAPARGEVIGFRDQRTVVTLYGPLTGIRHGNRVRLSRSSHRLRVGRGLLGRVVDAHGQTIDGQPRPTLDHCRLRDQKPPSAIDRPRIRQPLSTGIRAIDGLLTCGRGQRMGIFSGSGVGKSVALGMMARYTSADVNVIALIGERGREVNEFIQRDLGPSALARSVVVVATSDEPAILRVQAAKTATAIAEYFRDQGNDVLLVMDSLTRFAMAQREIGLAAGEPPTTRGYPPSVFSLLPKLVERAGADATGTITAFYSVLVEGDDTNEPVADTVRGLLDGHTVLSRKLASQGHYPAIDVLQSVSRLAMDVTTREHQRASVAIRRLLATYREHEDLIAIGAYRPGSNRDVDTAIALREELRQFLCQPVDQPSDLAGAKDGVLRLAELALHAEPSVTV